VSDRPLHAVSALKGLAVPGRHGKTNAEPGLVVAERLGLGLATVAARRGAPVRAAVKSSYRVDLPDDSTVGQGPEVSFVGYGPGQWLAVSETLVGDALAGDLKQRLKGLASVSDQSGGRTVLRLSGPRARDVLAKGLPIDLHPKAFGPGSAATSTISLMGVQLWQVDEVPTYDIALFRSLSASFWRWLTASAAKFGYEVTTS
jgi:methylglutamate dehydrogenase subunit D